MQAQVPGLGYTKGAVYQRDIGLLKRYNDHTFKLIYMRALRSPGFESRDAPSQAPRSKGHEAQKMTESLSRTRRVLFELALCNPWEYFITLTISPERHDRHDLPGTYKRLAKWLNNYNTRQSAAVRYLLVPEPHRDGAWHFHGLLFGLPPPHLTPFTLRDHIPRRLKDMLRTGRKLYNWPAYAEAFGFTSLEVIQDLDRCASYMTKYITKELRQSSIELNHHLYYRSQGLQRAQLIYQGPLLRPIEAPDFENEYTAIKQFSRLEEALPYFCDKEC